MIRAAVRHNSDELNLKAFDKELNDLYESIVNTQPKDSAEAKLLVNFLLDQLAEFHDLRTDKPEIDLIRRTVDLFMNDT